MERLHWGYRPQARISWHSTRVLWSQLTSKAALARNSGEWATSHDLDNALAPRGPRKDAALAG